MIHFEDVTKKYDGDSVVLDGVTFQVSPGELISIVGHSGAGKTTLMKMLLAQDRPTSGSVYLKSRDVHTLRKHELNELRRAIGTVFQDFKLLPDKTVFENIAFAMEAAGKTDEEIESDVPYVLELVGLDQKAWRFPEQLSGGEKQRVAIARAIINQPDVLIADEPTGNLDPLHTQDIVSILERINELGTTVLLTTHNKGVIDSLGKRVITIENGKIIRDDPEGKYVL